jgi:hypothetical protein
MASWRVLRQDDNGNTFLVADALDEDAALRLAAELEARGHKQLYFVERAPEASALSPGSGGEPPAPARKP